MIIADQLTHSTKPGTGVHKLIAMLGAKLTAQDDRLAIRFKMNPKMNHCEIILDPNDMYSMNFYNIRAGRVTIVKEFEGVYFDMLREIFESTTGLSVSL